MPNEDAKALEPKKKSPGRNLLAARTKIKRSQILLICGVLAVIGIVAVLLTRASSSPNCAASPTPGNGWSVCLRVQSQGVLYAQADYFGSSAGDILKSGTVTLFTCTTPDLTCTQALTSSTVTHNRLNQPSPHSWLATSTLNYNSDLTYRACLNFTTKGGFTQGVSCTQIITYRNGYAQVYTVPTLSPSPTAALTPSPSASNVGTTNGCSSLASNNSTLKYCVLSSPGYNALLATADYVAADTNSEMTSGTLSLEICSPQTSVCTPADTSNQVQYYNANQPRFQRMFTHGITFLLGANYRTCMTMTTAQGWNLTESCTPILSYGNNVSNPPQMVTAAAQPAATAATTTSNNSACNEPGLQKSDGSAWQCSFDDEFSGSGLDSSKWSPILSSNATFNQAPDCYVNSPNNISVSGGVLNLTSRKEAAPFTCNSAGRTPYSAQVTSGTVSTYQKFSQDYGRYEIRAKVPNVTTPGLQESFWLWPDQVFDQDPSNRPWPGTGEIDIAEMYHKYSDRAIPFVHYLPASTDGNITNNYCYIDISQYHTYTLTWSPDTIQIDVDGYNCVTDHPNPSSPQSGAQPFNKTFFLNLTSGLGESVNGNAYIDGTTPLPATTQVDYVRVWK